RLLHVQRHEHRLRLADAEGRARARLSLHGSSLDRVVSALRNVAVAARADAVRRLPGEGRPVALRAVPAARPSRRVPRDLADHAVVALARVHDLPVLTPVDEAGRFYGDYGWLHGLSTTDAADQIVGFLGEKGFLVEAGLYTHRYPHCWRCDTPLIWRLSDDWFISVEELRQPLLDANATVEWTPEYMGKRT